MKITLKKDFKISITAFFNKQRSYKTIFEKFTTFSRQIIKYILLLFSPKRKLNLLKSKQISFFQL